jgi:drug/metabolite transporter (DMT)-like permease
MVNKKISLTYSPLMTILYLFVIMAIIIIPFNLDSETISSVTNLSTVGWALVLFLGLFCSGIAYVIWARALRDMESAKVGAFLYLEPLITVFAAWFFLSEEITLLMIFSGLLITIGVIIVNKD